MGRKEGKKYDGIAKGSLEFSLNSKHLAYVAQKDAKWFVVVDRNEEKHYDAVFRGGESIFDSSGCLHYLAQKGSFIYLVKKLIE